MKHTSSNTPGAPSTEESDPQPRSTTRSYWRALSLPIYYFSLASTYLFLEIAVRHMGG